MMRASFLPRSPLLLLTVVLVALAVFFVHDARPAAASHDETIWSATLTLPSNSDFCDNGSSGHECSSRLNDDDITFNGVDYQVVYLTSVTSTGSPPGTTIGFDKAVPPEIVDNDEPPVVPPNAAPTVSAAIADATIVSDSGTRQFSLSGVFSDADGDGLTITASSFDENVATVSVSADHSTLTVTAQGRGTAIVTVTAADGKGGTVDNTFTVTVKAAPVVALPIADVSGLEAGDSRTISMSWVFRDADDGAVTVTEASSSDSAIVAVSDAIDGATTAITAVTVTARSEGTATTTVTAKDSDGNTISDAFDVTVPAPAAEQQQKAVEQRQERPLEPALVSNFGQERRVNDWPTNDFVLAQAFTTGNAATTLESIDVSIRVPQLHAGHIATVRAELWSTAEEGGPGDKIVDLVVPDVMEKGDIAFAAPAGTALAANTTYHFVLYTTGRVDLQVVATYSEDEDAGAEDGWSISDVTHHIRAQTPQDGDWVEVTVSGVMLMRVKGSVNEPPSITGDVADYAETTAAAANTATVASFTVTDPENAGANVLDLTGADASLFDLTEAGVLTFKAPPDYEAPADADKDNAYELTIGARDADGIRGTRDITVKVTNQDEPGTVTLSAVRPRVGVPISASLTDIDGPVSGVTWQWSITGATGVTGTDPTAAGDIDGATSNTYTPTLADVGGTLTATASYTDPQGAGKTATVDSTAAVAADTRNKVPVLSGSAAVSYAENGTDPVATYTATDPEGGLFTWSLSGDDAGAFTLTGGVLAFRSSPDYENPADTDTDNVYEVTVTAADPSGLSNSIDVTVTVTDTNENRPPAFPSSETGARSVAELTAANTPIGAPVRAEDPDRDTLTYSLGGTDMASFGIVTGTGQLQSHAALDYESKASYSVTVTATDPDGLSDSIDVAITVTDVDETGPEQTLLERYDADSSGAIEQAEVMTAINDYLFGTGDDAISKAEVIEVINLYLFGS